MTRLLVLRRWVRYMLTIEDFGVICLRVEHVNVLKLPVYTSSSWLYITEIASLVHKTLGGISIKEVFKIKAIVSDWYACRSEGQSAT
jgi:hypothetical protein